MPEALARVKQELGSDAVILHTRTHPRRKLPGGPARHTVEVTAAASLETVPEAMRRSTQSKNRPNRETNIRSGHSATATKANAPADTAPDALFDVYRRLIESDVAHEIASQLIESLEQDLSPAQRSDESCVKASLSKRLLTMLPSVCEIDLASKSGPVVVALVGPSGVGKTTTLAKLAADFSLRKNRSVGCISLDARKIGATEQIAAYANIIDVPLQVIENPAELQAAIATWFDLDVILIDTPGLSPHDTASLIALTNQLESIEVDETHLVLPATIGGRAMRDAVERFATVGADRLLLSKQDEAIGMAVILNAVHQTQMKISYMTTGEDVPDGLSLSPRESLAESISAQVALME
ncbi:MAG: hypothetical protein DHS20C16_25970 [Phycisphaerae bacterium]|nr:MAG: hypothetical protein DHS20C16_25970 [Phycisphaerae bacterium]